MKTKLFTLFFALVVSVGTTFAVEVQIGDLYYNLDSSNETAEVTSMPSGKYTGDIVIPPSVEYKNAIYSVTSIGDYAFKDCTSLSSIEIPNSVISIGERAFTGCESLTSIVVESGNTTYDSRNNCNAIIETAFNTLIAGCKNTIIPNSVISIGEEAFYYCTGLTSITIPNSVTSIEYAAFAGCTSLTSIEIPNSVTSIGNYAFYYCTGLTSVTIPNSVTNIGKFVFSGCSNLTSITIPSSVASIGEGTFRYCSGLTSIVVEKGNATYDSRDNCNALIETATNTLIYGCQNTIIPNSVTSIWEKAFYSCTGLTSITIPISVTNFGERVFFECPNLTHVIWNARNASEAAEVFGGRRISSPVESFVFGNEVEVIPDELCLGMSKLTNVTIPNSVKRIGVSAFSGCSSLTSVTIGNSVTSIEYAAFADCTSLTSILIPDNVTTIERRAFEGCSSLPVIDKIRYADTYLVEVADNTMFTYTIKSGTRWIGSYAFYDCTNMSSINIPNSVTSIGYEAFAGCSGLMGIICEAIAPPTCESSFSEVDKSIPIYVPASSVDAYKTTEGWKMFTNILPFQAEKVEVEGVAVETKDNSADITWPQVSGAYTYELVIKDKAGNIVCTLVFNAQGQLLSIKFNAPAQNGAPQHTQAAGFVFTITGLEDGTYYSYSITAKNESGTILNVEEGTFRTQSLEAVNEVSDGQSRGTKLFRDGQILIQKGDKTFDLRGQEMH